MTPGQAVWRLALASFAAATLACAAPAHAQSGDQLTGTLKKAKDSGSVTLGYREASLPFSYVNARGEPVGYSIELCKEIVNAMSEEVGKELAIRWQAVTPENRIDAVASGQVDLECGSTTSSLERQKRVAFSPIIFVAGTQLMVKRGSPIKRWQDLAGKTVAVTAGTTNEKALRELVARARLEVKFIVGRDHSESFALLKQGQADAFATDDVLLYGLIAKERSKEGAADDFTVVGDFLSYDPYGLMYRKGDAPLDAVVKRSFTAMADSRELEHLYTQWFLRRLPSGERLNLPMSAQLDSIFRVLATQPE
jgi:glutamate/aspartate transport system substrate-binding protein